jgi:hypothetical protein
VKFSREYEASIIPEWKAAFVDYKCLKKLVKKIKVARRDEDPASDESPSTTTFLEEDALVDVVGGGESGAGGYGFSVLDPVRALAARFAPRVRASSVRAPLLALAHALSGCSCACTVLMCITCCSLLCISAGGRGEPRFVRRARASSRQA